MNITSKIVIIVEDNEKTSTKVMKLLKKENIKLTILRAYSVRTGYRLIRKHPDALIYCDITILKPMTGIFLIKRMNKIKLKNRINIMSTAFNNNLFFIIFKYMAKYFIHVDGICKKNEIDLGYLIIHSPNK